MKIFFLTTLITIFSLFAVNFIHAQERIESQNFRIIFPNFNSGAGIPSSSNYSLNTTLGQTGPGEFQSSGYRVKAGFQYINSIIPFSFSVSDFTIDFGSLTPSTHTTQTTTLTVSAGGAGGYQIKASQDNPLESDASNQIPDTNCDVSCSETTAGLWTSSSRYGFGFNIDGDDVPGDFTNTNYFRQFADISGAESPQTIMSSNNVGRERQATLTFKINISPTQQAGRYKNIIKLSAVPGY